MLLPAPDKWTERLRCPQCRLPASVRLWQAKPDSPAYHDGLDQNVHVQETPAGFRTVVSELGCEFYCAGCGSLAHHMS
jgi:hypothetical protein